ncbi:MAG: hypothetical protein IPJ84_10150 [Bdellovibrionales bacterium]|nr:hypothetical protein [Bdellovibrionales bacterium]
MAIQTKQRLELAKHAALLLAAMAISACQTVPYQGQARDVKRRPGEGGVVVIKVDHRPEDRDVAEQKMRSNCGALEVRVESEEEVVVGQKTEGSSRDTNREADKQQVGSLFGIPVVSGDAGGVDSQTSTTTTQLKEWQIAYKCVAPSGSPKKVK